MKISVVLIITEHEQSEEFSSYNYPFSLLFCRRLWYNKTLWKQFRHLHAKNIRHINGGLRYVKAMGVDLKERNITQVSINMTDYTRTALYRAFELVRIEARRYGVTIVGSEIIGLVPMEALIDTASYYLGLENFSMQQVLEARIME